MLLHGGPGGEDAEPVDEVEAEEQARQDEDHDLLADEREGREGRGGEGLRSGARRGPLGGKGRAREGQG